MADKRSYTGGHFELLIDGHSTTSYLRAIEGGFSRGQIIEESVGPENKKVKHLGPVEVDPFTVDFALAGAKDMLQWIKNSWDKKFDRRNGQMTHADFDLKKTFEHQFFDALICETTFPALDGSSKESAYFKVKIQPEKIMTVKQSGGTLPPAQATTKQQQWLPWAFRFSIDGIDDMRYTNKIESFTIKQNIKKLYTGDDRFPQIEPTSISFPNILGTISLQYADKLLDWHESVINQGTKDTKAQKTGSIEFLTPDRKSTIFRVNLFEVGIIQAAIESSKANQEQIKRVKFELYVGRMELDPSAPGLQNS